MLSLIALLLALAPWPPTVPDDPSGPCSAVEIPLEFCTSPADLPIGFGLLLDNLLAVSPDEEETDEGCDDPAAAGPPGPPRAAVVASRVRRPLDRLPELDPNRDRRQSPRAPPMR
jgi:hypothetical protein